MKPRWFVCWVDNRDGHGWRLEACDTQAEAEDEAGRIATKGKPAHVARVVADFSPAFIVVRSVKEAV